MKTYSAEDVRLLIYQALLYIKSNDTPEEIEIIIQDILEDKYN